MNRKISMGIGSAGIGMLALAGCGYFDYTVKPVEPTTPVEPITIVGELPPEDSKAEDKAEKPWAELCVGWELEEGKYRAVITGKNGKTHNVIYEVNIFQDGDKTCQLHLNKDAIISDGSCNDTVDSVFSFNLKRRVYRSELEKWDQLENRNLTGFFDEKLKSVRLVYVCSMNLIKPEVIEGVEGIVEKFR